MELSSDSDNPSCSDTSKVSVLEVLDVTLVLGDDDNRYGFSIMGGMDEGFCPRVEDIAKGNSIINEIKDVCIALFLHCRK